MDIVNSSSINLLDKIRFVDGRDRLTDYYTKLSKKNLKMAMDLINQESLSFTALFLLQPTINALSIFENLSIRNKIGIDLINETTMYNEPVNSIYLSPKHVQKVYSVMKWVLETGAPDDGLSDKFDELLDISAAVLTKEYRDWSVLPVITDMIFKRNKRGFFIHDLVWAFFESRDTKSLVLIGNKLQSEEPRDVELACKLLSFVPGIGDEYTKECDEKYSTFINWIEENIIFLRFTGESFQLTRKPIVYEINLEAKYLCKMVSIDTGETLKALNEKECELLDEFKILDVDNRRLLSGFSLSMHRKNLKLWEEWMRNPIIDQLRIARSGGVYND
ncbi:MAG: hypothetical protein K0R09_345 [Clostridiales bacterium]|jgi:hypothetical protein|nr:hypothetical protein [Clostridiales bacterium]